MRTLFFLALWLACQSALAVIIPAGRRTVWQDNVGVPGGIPTRTTIYTNFNPGATTTQINAAIASCPSNQVVYLNAGQYYMNGTVAIYKDGVTLRGAGRTNTVLHFTNSVYNAVQMGGVSYEFPPNAGNVKDWTAGYTQGTTNITISAIGTLTAGAVLVLDQTNAPQVTSLGSEGNCGCGRVADGSRAQEQVCIVQAISGTTVTIWPPIMMTNWQSTLTPQVWWGSATVQRDGIEDLTIDNLVADCQNNVAFDWAHSCWLKNVLSQYGHEGNVRTVVASGCEIRDSYFQYCHSYASDNYGAYVANCSAILFENNIYDTITVPLNVKESSSGCVFGYNYFVNMRYDSSANWQIASILTHGAHSCMHLFEGNYGSLAQCDFIHGSGGHQTFFRNRFYGPEFTNHTSNTKCLEIFSTNYWINVVGNVLGTSGYHTNYMDANNHNATDKMIFKLGYTIDNLQFDSFVTNTVLIHGNYDTVTAGIVWDSNIADHTLPDSLYLASKPSWFGTNRFPAIAPELTPLVVNIPAQDSYAGVSPGGGGAGGGGGASTTNQVSIGGNVSFGRVSF